MGRMGRGNRLVCTETKKERKTENHIVTRKKIKCFIFHLSGNNFALIPDNNSTHAVVRWEGGGSYLYTVELLVSIVKTNSRCLPLQPIHTLYHIHM